MIIFGFYGQNQKEIYFNFPTKLAKAKTVDLGLIFSNTLKNCYLFLDEAYLLIDSRHSSSNVNINMSYQLFQIRKNDIDIYLATQLSRTIDIRFLLQVDCIIQCYRYPESLQLQPEYFQYEFITQDTKTIWNLPFEKAKQFFPLYNTKEQITSENITDNQLRIIKQTNPQQFCLMSKDIAKQIYLKRKGEILTREEIVLELQELNKAKIFEDNCYILCKKWRKEELEKLEKLKKKTKKKTEEKTNFSYYKGKYIDSELAEEKTIQHITKRMKRKR